MFSKYHHITVEKDDDVFIVGLRHRRLQELEIHELADEVHALINADGCRKLVLVLGPDCPEFLFSVFISKLVGIRRRMSECHGAMRLTEVGPEVMGVFQACQLQNYFDFSPDRASAVVSLKANA
jgi:anti-anti-sigma factor